MQKRRCGERLFDCAVSRTKQCQGAVQKSTGQSEHAKAQRGGGRYAILVVKMESRYLIRVKLDFEQALKLEPANESVKAELKKLVEMLQAQSQPRKVREHACGSPVEIHKSNFMITVIRKHLLM